MLDDITNKDMLCKNWKSLTNGEIQVRLSSLRSQGKWFFWEVTNATDFGLDALSMLGWTTKRKAINNFERMAKANGWKKFKWLLSVEEVAAQARKEFEDAHGKS